MLMPIRPFLLASELSSLQTQEALNPRAVTGLFKTDTVIIFGAIVVVTALVFFWAFFLRKRPAEVLYRTREADSRSSSGGSRFGSSSKRKRKRRRSDHPDHLPRNPTLAEAGGLPPLRPDEPESPAEPESSRSQ